MLKKASSYVLASLKGLNIPNDVCLAPSLAAALLVERRVLARWGWAGKTAAFLNIRRIGHNLKDEGLTHG